MGINFNGTVLTFPDGTTQTTAASGGGGLSDSDCASTGCTTLSTKPQLLHNRKG